MRLRARHYRTAQMLDVVCERHRSAPQETPGMQPRGRKKPNGSPPRFCDVRINGCHGVSFNADTLTNAQIRSVVETCRRHGIAQLMPTLVTGPFDALMHGFRTIREACDQ